MVKIIYFRVINEKAELLYKAIQKYNELMCEHGGTLKEHISDLHSVAENLDRVHIVITTVKIKVMDKGKVLNVFNDVLL